jgi:hypothetical protein
MMTTKQGQLMNSYLPPNETILTYLSDANRQFIKDMGPLYPKAAFIRAALKLLIEKESVRQRIRQQDFATTEAASSGNRNPTAIAVLPATNEAFRAIAIETLEYGLTTGYRPRSNYSQGLSLTINLLLDFIRSNDEVCRLVKAWAREPGIRSIPRGGWRPATKRKRDAEPATA